MADVNIAGSCTYDRAWIGKCGKPTDETYRCSEHEKVKCVSCGAQADGECDYTGQFVCGAPLCKACTGWEDRSKPSGGWGFMNHQHVSRQWLAQRASIGDTPAPQSTEGGDASFATDSRCTYLARAAGICNKCGRVHDGKPNPSVPFGSAGAGYATVGAPAGSPMGDSEANKEKG